MKSLKDKREETTEGRAEVKRPRFRIEKLEERIAPNKGGIPAHHQHCTTNGYGLICCGHGKYPYCYI